MEGVSTPYISKSDVVTVVDKSEFFKKIDCRGVSGIHQSFKSGCFSCEKNARNKQRQGFVGVTLPLKVFIDFISYKHGGTIIVLVFFEGNSSDYIFVIQWG